MKTARETRLSRANEQTTSYTEVYKLITLQSTTSLWIHLGLEATDVTELDKTAETFQIIKLLIILLSRIEICMHVV